MNFKTLFNKLQLPNFANFKTYATPLQTHLF